MGLDIALCLQDHLSCGIHPLLIHPLVDLAGRPGNPLGKILPVKLGRKDLGIMLLYSRKLPRIQAVLLGQLHQAVGDGQHKHLVLA